MHTVQLYVEESLDSNKIDELRHTLINMPYVFGVEISSKSPHEFVIEFEEHRNMPMQIIELLKAEGYHPDIFSG